MSKKLNKIAIIFLILMVAIPIFSFNVGATESVIWDNSLSISNHGDNIIVSSNGSMYCTVKDSAGNHHFIYASHDDGATWSSNLDIADVDGTVYQIQQMCANNTHIFCFYSYLDGTTSYTSYRENGGSGWSAKKDAYNMGNNLAGFYGIDAITDSENMYVVNSIKDSTGGYDLQLAYYNFQLDTWSIGIDLISNSPTPLYNPNILLYDDNLYIFYTNNSNIDLCIFDIATATYSDETIIDTTYTYKTPHAIKKDFVIYLFYSGNTSTSNSKDAILYKIYSGSSWSSQNTICEDTGYNQLYPVANLNSNGDINVVWYGQSVISTVYNQLRSCVYSGGSWGSIAFITSGASDKKYPNMVYQQNPSYTHLVSGISMAFYDDTNNDIEYIDSDSLIWYTGDAGEEYEGEFEFDANNNIGSLDTGCTLGLTIKTVEFKYMVPTTINATGFDLFVNKIMHSYDSDLSNYDLYINGESMGNPTEWKQYSGHYVLRWIFTSEKVITNSEILFEVWHDKIVGSVYNYWVIGMSCNYEDLDGDGVAFSKVHDVYPNGAFDGKWLQKDVAYQLYFNVISFVEDETDVTYNSISHVNTTYYVGDSVPLTYTVKSSDLVYDNYVRIWNDDTATEITAGSMQGFPYLCTHQVETIGFVPFTSANYTAHLYINGATVDNISFFADEQINANMSVFTYPNPSKVGQKVWVKYNFDHPTGKDGAIFLSLTPNLNNYISVNYLSDGDNGFWTTTYDTVGIYYYIMAVDINGNGTYGIVNNGVHPHTVRSEHGNNYFTLSGYNLRLNVEGTVTQIVNGECNMISGNCYIYDNNQLVKTITESPFSYSYEVHTAGLHTVEMRLITNVTTILCTQNYTVTTYTGEQEIEQVEDSGYVVRDYIYNNYGDFGIFIAGVLIILGFMFIPFALVLYVNVAFNKNVALGDIHWGIYLIFAIVGVIVVVQLHLADLWIVLLICVVSIAITVISYNGRNG